MASFSMPSTSMLRSPPSAVTSSVNGGMLSQSTGARENATVTCISSGSNVVANPCAFAHSTTSAALSNWRCTYSVRGAMTLEPEIKIDVAALVPQRLTDVDGLEYGT